MSGTSKTEVQSATGGQFASRKESVGRKWSGFVCAASCAALGQVGQEEPGVSRADVVCVEAG